MESMVKMIRQRVGLLLVLPALPIVASAALVMDKEDAEFSLSRMLAAWLREWKSIGKEVR